MFTLFYCDHLANIALVFCNLQSHRHCPPERGTRHKSRRGNCGTNQEAQIIHFGFFSHLVASVCVCSECHHNASHRSENNK